VTPPPQALADQGVTHSSSRRLAGWLRRNKQLQVSHDSITQLWNWPVDVITETRAYHLDRHARRTQAAAKDAGLLD